MDSRWRSALFAIAAGCAILAPRGARAQRSKQDSIAIHDSVVAYTTRFIAQYDTAWMFSEHDRHGFAAYGDAITDDGSRHANYHCHPDFKAPRGPIAQGRLIRSGGGWFAVCPSFELGDIKTTIEERGDIDAALLDARRTLVREKRGSLIAKLDTAVHAIPGDDFVTGQLVRFLVDQWKFDAALTAARGCVATAWWCAALTGYVHASRNENPQADSAFSAAFAAMSEDDRCHWTDYHIIIDVDGRDNYDGTSCAKRAALNDRIWWLADPLFMEPGNERRVEQNSRLVQLALRTALPRGEHTSWSVKTGGDAHRAMVERYGWPSYSYWGGPGQDNAHSGYLVNNHTAPNPPYTTYEYLGARLHLIPKWSAIEDPFHAVPRDWAITETAERDSEPPTSKGAASIAYTNQRVVALPTYRGYWWPIEHAQTRRPLVQLPEGTHAVLRRYDAALLAVATELPPQILERKAGDTVRSVTLVASTAPDVVRKAAVIDGIAGRSLEVHGLIDAAPALAGIEFPGGPARAVAGGRMRFGITPGAPLKTLRANEIAISDPVILRAPPGGGDLPTETNAALREMATTNVIPARGRLGVYWETYGISPSDSVEVAVWIERATGQSIVRRFGIALGVTTDLNTPIAISWKEPDPGHRAYIVTDNVVPIVARSVVVDVANLPAGEYNLDIAVRRLGQPEPVRGRTLFVVK